MNPTYSIFEPCDTVQTTVNDFEPCDTVQTKKGRGGARANSGMKSNGIETVTVRIDKRLLNVVTAIKHEFKDGTPLDDIIGKPQSQNDAELKRQNFALNNVNKHLCDCLENEKQARISEVKQLNDKIKQLNLLMDLLQASSNAVLAERAGASGIDDKLRKRLIQFCHPDKNQDRKELANELVQALNGLAK